jgi:hypothetical protein
MAEDSNKQNKKDKQKPKVGDYIKIKVDGTERITYIDYEGIQRFPENKLLRHLVNSGQISLSRLANDYEKGEFSLDELKVFYMRIGYSVNGFDEIFGINGNLPKKLQAKIENPLWD